MLFITFLLRFLKLLPPVNLRWYLENAGMKNSRSYIINGVVMFVSWLVAARIVLFVYLFYHISAAHYDQAARIVMSVYLFYHISAAHYDQVFLNKLHLLPNSKSKVTTLHGASGIVKPGRMTLLHGPGPPSLGKTTLLLALAGKLDNDLNVSGKVTYNGHEMKEFVPETTSAYISQYDLHMGMGELTVRETLAFSAQVQGVGARYEMLKELSRKEKEANIKPDPDIDIYRKAARIVLFMYLFYHIMISRLLFCCVIMESKCTYIFSRCAEKVPLL